MWHKYARGRGTLQHLSKEYECDAHTIRTILDTYKLATKTHTPRHVTVIIDATYFGRGYGILVARDPIQKDNLHCMEIVSETRWAYEAMRKYLENLGYTIHAVVLDGKRGVRSVFKDIPIQMCQFHQWSIIRRKLTLHPKLEAHWKLLRIGMEIPHLSERELTDKLITFEKKWNEFMREKTYILGCNRWYYTHKKLRSALYSITCNARYLYTYQKYPELNIPNTTNSLDGTFGVLKDLLRVHRGLTKERRLKLIRYILGC